MKNLAFLAILTLGLGCKAATGAQCNLNEDCETGICHQGKCATADDVKLAAAQRCREAKGCKLQGDCTADEQGRCVVGSSKDCEDSLACPTEGKCEAKGTTCIATKNEHCAKTELCTVGGRCTAKAGLCVVGGNEDCAKTAACPPACTVVDGPGDQGKICGVGSDEDCSKTQGCKQRGQCSISKEGSPPRCVAVDNADCVKPCRKYGNCAIVGDEPYCQPRSDRDCQASRACLEDERCKLVDGACATPPPEPEGKEPEPEEDESGEAEDG